MQKNYKLDLKNGYYLFKLEKLLEDKKISKNKVIRETNIDFKVLKRIWSGNLTRIDITILAKLLKTVNMISASLTVIFLFSFHFNNCCNTIATSLHFRLIIKYRNTRKCDRYPNHRKDRLLCNSRPHDKQGTQHSNDRKDGVKDHFVGAVQIWLLFAEDKYCKN